MCVSLICDTSSSWALKELNKENYFKIPQGLEKKMGRLLKTMIIHVYKPLPATSVLDLAGTGAGSASSHFRKTKPRHTCNKGYATILCFCFI